MNTKDLTLLLKKKRDVSNVELLYLSKVYEDIYNEYLAEFGLNDRAQEIREIRIRYITNLSLFLQGDRSVETFIDIDKLMLDDFTNEAGTGHSIWKLKSQMEVALKIQIDIKKCSVVEFYSYLSIISEMNKNIKNG